MKMVIEVEIVAKAGWSVQRRGNGVIVERNDGSAYESLEGFDVAGPIAAAIIVPREGAEQGWEAIDVSLLEWQPARGVLP